MNIAVFVSGNGSNLQALIDAEKHGELAGGKISLVVSDKPGAFAVARAGKAGIRTFVLEDKGFESREDYDKTLLKGLAKEKIDLVVLAGFMRIFTTAVLEKYGDIMINIHPSLLPSFKGAHAIRDAHEAGVKTTGVTVHFVTEDLDSGPVIIQEEVEVFPEDTMEMLEEKIHSVEHHLYPEAISLFVQGRLELEEGKVKILD